MVFSVVIFKSNQVRSLAKSGLQTVFLVASLLLYNSSRIVGACPAQLIFICISTHKKS